MTRSEMLYLIRDALSVLNPDWGAVHVVPCLDSKHECTSLRMTLEDQNGSTCSCKIQVTDERCSGVFQCPKCGATKEDLLFVQQCTEYHTIDQVYEDGGVDLLSLADTFPIDDTSYFSCQKCETQFRWGRREPL